VDGGDLGRLRIGGGARVRAFVLSVALMLGLAPGLSSAEHQALASAGAFGHHPVKVLLLGDSIALTLGIGLTKGAQSHYGVTISNHSTLGCDLDPELEILTSGQPGPATPGCGQWRALWPFLTASVHPDVVALGVGRWEVSDHLYRGHWVHIGQKVWDDHIVSDLRAAVRIFHLFGAKVVLFTMPYIDPSDRQADGQPWAENTPQFARIYNGLVQQVARSDPREVSVIDLNQLLGPGGVFTLSVHGVRVRWVDGIHISAAGGQYLQPHILPAMDRLGLEAEAAVARVEAQEQSAGKTASATSHQAP
jgi:hypothetical protein